MGALRRRLSTARASLFARFRASALPFPLPRVRAGETKGARAFRQSAKIACGLAAISICLPSLAAEHPPHLYIVIGDAIPASLTGKPGDPTRGKAIVASRQTGLCLLCHSAPLPEEKFQGTIGPDLKGAGSRYTEGQLRLRIVDSSLVDPGTIMPSYYRLDGLDRVAPAFRGKTVLTADEIEDVVAFLMTLRDDTRHP
jgi:L-cysteine S-thiosulfotransferase